MKDVMLKGIEMYESLIKSVVSAGGSPKAFGIENLESMSVIELISRLATNGVRFHFDREGHIEVKENKVTVNPYLSDNNLYLVSRKGSFGTGQYGSFVVCAESSNKATETHPEGREFFGHFFLHNSWDDSSGVWVDRPSQATALFLGKANKSVSIGVVHSVIKK